MAAKYAEAVADAGGPLVWTGETPGLAECREFGWWSALGIEDMNRYARACAGREPGFRWDATARKLVRIQ